MKKLLFFFAILSFIAFGCTKQDQLEPDVKISIDYKFSSQSSVISARAFAPDYDAFYNKYIVGRLLTPALYDITFTNTTTKLIVNVNGKWSSDKLLKLPSGTYQVSGISVPYYSASGDTCMLSFSEPVIIESTTSKITLIAKYECSLLLFDNANISTGTINYQNNGYPQVSPKVDMTLLRTEKFVHLFVNRYAAEYNTSYQIMITRLDGTHSLLYINNYVFSFGKYYYFGDITGEYALPPMEPIN